MQRAVNFSEATGVHDSRLQPENDGVTVFERRVVLKVTCLRALQCRLPVIPLAGTDSVIIEQWTESCNLLIALGQFF